MRLLMSPSAYASAGPQVMSALEIEQTNWVWREREAPNEDRSPGSPVGSDQSATADRNYPPYRQMAVPALAREAAGSRLYLRSRWADHLFAIQHDKTGTLLGAVNVLVDITERKQAEAQLQASLHEKEVLLKEIHHRVKNNLQVIASLLYLQSDQLKDPADLALFEDTQNRVKSMALVHESLYRTGDLARFNFAQYIESLTSHLFQAHVAESSGICLDMELDEVILDVDTAIPCGLILNELLTNALTYACPDGRFWTIHITLRAADEHVTLSVRNTGIGLPKDFELRSTESLGLQLVGMMTEQLGGMLTLTCEAGTVFTISIPYRTRQVKEEAYAPGPDSDRGR